MADPNSTFIQRTKKLNTVNHNPWVTQIPVDYVLKDRGMGSLITNLLLIYCRVDQWKNFENWSAFGEVMDKSTLKLFVNTV